MKKALIWTAQLGAGVGCGILLSYNMNQVYYFSIRRHVYVPVKSEWEQEHKDWD